jgi:hypothetical protein
MKKEHFIHFFPFLNKKYRTIELSEITSEATFKELFPNEKIDYSKLNAVYHYQNLESIEVLDLANEILLAHKVDPKNLTPSKVYDLVKDLNLKPKKKRNAKI